MNKDFEEGFRTAYNFECDQCDETFKRRASLSHHVMNVHTDKKFNCLYCDQKFARQDNLKRYVQA